MKRKQVDNIASLITEDPNIHPSGGIHPGRDNQQSFERSGSGRFEVRKIDRISGRSSRWLRFFGMNAQSAEMYLPLYFVFKDGQPYIAGSPKNRNEWYNTEDMQLKKASSELLSALKDAGVPDEMMPSPPTPGGSEDSGLTAFPTMDGSETDDDPGMEGGMDIGDYDDPENDSEDSGPKDSGPKDSGPKDSDDTDDSDDKEE